MPRHAPATRLATHEVLNHPTDPVDRNLYAFGTALADAVRRGAGDWLDRRCMALGAEYGTEQVTLLGEQANANPPALRTHDRYGRRIDEVEFHPSYHELMARAMRHRIHDIAWTEPRPGRHLAHAALLALATEAEAGTMCPINMTYASVPALTRYRDRTSPLLDRLIGGEYDAPLAPIGTKRGLTIGMAMTEKQGGSDVRANATRATPRPAADGTWSLVGHKWFCSAPMSDAFLTTAQTDLGLSCFLVPRIASDGERNAIQLVRLKQKLGNRSNASAEIEYHGAEAIPLGDPGRGLSVILDMVHHTRLGTIAATLGIMRASLAEAIRHTAGRTAFRRRLADQPAMRAVLADLALELEAATALVARVAIAFDADGGDNQAERAFARLSVAAAKYLLTKRCPGFVAECMECLGGSGYVDESPMPRLLRESPLNAIWEGSGNVIALDILRTLDRAPAAREALSSELATSSGAHPALDALVSELRADLDTRTPIGETEGRATAERIAVALQGNQLARHAPRAVADAWIATRLAARRPLCYGALPAGIDLDSILARVE